MVELHLLAFLQLDSGEHGAFRERKRSQAPRAIEHGTKCFTALNGGIPRKTHLTDERDLLLLAPFRNLLHVQEIERLKCEVCALVATQDGAEVNLNKQGLSYFALDVIARELRLCAICRVLQTAAGTQQAAHAHAGLQWIVPAGFHASVDAYHLGRRVN